MIVASLYILRSAARAKDDGAHFQLDQEGGFGIFFHSPERAYHLREFSYSRR
jgi:hypothetical protein